ncbi:hypothetical protein CCM_08406 [Cordyceps militaris CM01]|uniref:Uncharacterized protein n=1 Tax=Cordyceps militaris (strain CM01) TaxID=983644 RepID=G3JR67_CORMM|nr:uncharacterized protein CCM_08406 [Cordyceps militaris CM01]EGX88363.1 hypothetical protein CCM_08406 [Cordyceps militaris CM01]
MKDETMERDYRAVDMYLPINTCYGRVPPLKSAEQGPRIRLDRDRWLAGCWAQDREAR